MSKYHRYNCVVDASSYVNLTLFNDYAGKTLLEFFTEQANIHFCRCVNQEINRHRTEFMPKPLTQEKSVYNLQYKTFKEYELKLFDEYDEGKKNRGEKWNLAVTLDMFLSKGYKNLVYVIDDFNALRGVLKTSLYSFPLYQIWSSFDVIVYLLIDHKNFTRDLAINALKDINANLANDDPKTKREKTERRITNLNNYIKKIERVQKLIVK